ncbi:MAG: hypothetical protein ACOC5T_05445 [Elusimicrobiota bacterium]
MATDKVLGLVDIRIVKNSSGKMKWVKAIALGGVMYFLIRTILRTLLL